MQKPTHKATPSPDAKPEAGQSPYGMPTVEQLAQLAAALAPLAGGLSRKPLWALDPELKCLPYVALKLWKAAEAVHFEAAQHYISPVEMAAYNATLPSLPGTPEEFLRQVLPDVRPGDRKHAWQHYTLALSGKNFETATLAEIEAAKAAWKPPESHASFILAKLHFESWWKPFHAAEVSALRRKAGEKKERAGGKKKRKARPPVEKLKAALKAALLT